MTQAEYDVMRIVLVCFVGLLFIWAIVGLATLAGLSPKTNKHARRDVITPEDVERTSRGGGCRNCKMLPMDIINYTARLYGLTNKEAIFQLAHGL